MINVIANSVDLNTLKERDKVILKCEYLATVMRHNKGELKGEVVEVFCIEDNHYQVDIRNATERFRWDSKRDGGMIYLLK